MGLFGDKKKFEPSPVYLKDITSCYRCRCLLFNSNAKRVVKTTIIKNQTGRITDSYCLRCAPAYHEIVYFFNSEYEMKPAKIQYFKRLEVSPRVECNENGEVIEANIPDMV